MYERELCFYIVHICIYKNYEKISEKLIFWDRMNLNKFGYLTRFSSDGNLSTSTTTTASVNVPLNKSWASRRLIEVLNQIPDESISEVRISSSIFKTTI